MYIDIEDCFCVPNRLRQCRMSDGQDVGEEVEDRENFSHTFLFVTQLSDLFFRHEYEEF